jgi:hypothetical protein
MCKANPDIFWKRGEECYEAMMFYLQGCKVYQSKSLRLVKVVAQSKDEM